MRALSVLSKAQQGGGKLGGLKLNHSYREITFRDVEVSYGFKKHPHRR